ncbi:MAG: MBL fold metallo-hydrolase [Firmicutes bacterium]|nr:MBL fold metallo-hydrolase [Bacillota bacterium]
MKEIYKNLYQFSVYIPPMDFTIHQYLLASDPAILFAAGTVQQAETVLPEIQKILGDRGLKYIFISHNESDEMGGIPVFQRAYPNVSVICSQLTARELSGLGINIDMIVKNGEENLKDGELNLKFANYPSEVHLQNGLVCIEESSGIFYSADLMLRYGNGVGNTIKSKWEDEVGNISEERVPNKRKLENLKTDLLNFAPCFVAVGHGYCIECEV